MLPDEEADPNTITVVDLEDTKVRVMADTGAAANTIDEVTYQSLRNKQELFRLDKPYFG